MDDRQYIVIEQNAELFWLDGKITNSGHIGQVDSTCSHLVMATYPDARRPSDLELNARIDGVRFSASGGIGIYSVVRVR